jgi:hypothetical protein
MQEDVLGSNTATVECWMSEGRSWIIEDCKSYHAYDE